MNTNEHVIVTSDQPWDPQGLLMPGGDNSQTNMNDERFIQQMRSHIKQNSNRHHNTYESDCVALTIDGNTEQLLYERMIKSVQVTDKQRLNEIQSTTIGTAQDIIAVTTQ